MICVGRRVALALLPRLQEPLEGLDLWVLPGKASVSDFE